jgi:hypothetical protein
LAEFSDASHAEFSKFTTSASSRYGFSHKPRYHVRYQTERAEAN